jgi:general secretion pathway protein G
VGADGQTQPQINNKVSLDDVIRALNGAYIGLASDF